MIEIVLGIIVLAVASVVGWSLYQSITTPTHTH